MESDVWKMCLPCNRRAAKEGRKLEQVISQQQSAVLQFSLHKAAANEPL